MMRKILISSVLIAMVVVLESFSATVSIPDMSGSTGSIVKIPVEIDDASGIAGFQLTLNFDESILVAQDASTGNLTDGWLIFYNAENEGQISIVCLNSNLEELGNESGYLVFVSFFVSGDIGASTEISISEANFHNSFAENIPVSLESGIFTVDVRKGDINEDEVIDISDVIMCLRMAIELPLNIGQQQYMVPYPSWLISRADMNNDGEVNISDVILTLRKAIGLD
ncbi:MAG: cohesin domain-containing protein [Candidatus Omnitrophica bacterium]|nr:cohesin domain-containing protein [Candidatus Omnitrophota bacterium]